MSMKRQQRRSPNNWPTGRIKRSWDGGRLASCLTGQQDSTPFGRSTGQPREMSTMKSSVTRLWERRACCESVRKCRERVCEKELARVRARIRNIDKEQPRTHAPKAARLQLLGVKIDEALAKRPTLRNLGGLLCSHLRERRTSSRNRSLAPETSIRRMRRTPARNPQLNRGPYQMRTPNERRKQTERIWVVRATSWRRCALISRASERSRGAASGGWARSRRTWSMLR